MTTDHGETTANPTTSHAGSSTRNEINHATSLGKEVRYLEPIGEVPNETSVDLARFDKYLTEDLARLAVELELHRASVRTQNPMS